MAGMEARPTRVLHTVDDVACTTYEGTGRKLYRGLQLVVAQVQLTAAERERLRRKPYELGDRTKALLGVLQPPDVPPWLTFATCGPVVFPVLKPVARVDGSFLVLLREGSLAFTVPDPAANALAQLLAAPHLDGGGAAGTATQAVVAQVLQSARTNLHFPRKALEKGALLLRSPAAELRPVSCLYSANVACAECLPSEQTLFETVTLSVYELLLTAKEQATLHTRAYEFGDITKRLLGTPDSEPGSPVGSELAFIACGPFVLPLLRSITVERLADNTYVFLLDSGPVGFQLPAEKTDAFEALLTDRVRLRSCDVAGGEFERAVSADCPPPAVAPPPGLPAMVPAELVQRALAQARRLGHLEPLHATDPRVEVVLRSLRQSAEPTPDEWVVVTEGRAASAEWQPDVADCQGCHAWFSVRLRRHHCRACGLVFCARCAPYFTTLSAFAHFKDHDPLGQRHRLCTTCYEALPRSSLERVPADVLHRIFLGLPPTATTSLASVCVAWRDVLDGDLYWADRAVLDLRISELPATFDGHKLAGRAAKDVYQMLRFNEYKQRRFSERPRTQQAGIVVLSVVASPLVVAWHSPQIARFVVERGVIPVGEGITRGAAAVASGAWHYVLVPTAEGTYRYVLAPVGRAIQFTAEQAARAAMAIAHGTYNYILVPIGNALVAGARGAARAAQMVAQAVNEYIIQPSIRLAVGAVRATKNYLLIPLGKGILATLHFALIRFPQLIYSHILTPLAVGAQALIKGTYTHVVAPLGRGIYRFVLSPIARGTKWLVTRTFTHVILPFGHCVYRFVLVPLGNGVLLLGHFTFDTLPNLVLRYVINPIVLAGHFSYEHVLVPLGRAIKRVARMLCISLPKAFCRNVLVPVYQRILFPAAHAIGSGIAAVGFGLFKVGRFVVRSLGQALRLLGRGVGAAVGFAAHQVQTLATGAYRHILVPAFRAARAVVHWIHNSVVRPSAHAVAFACRFLWNNICVPLANLLGAGCNLVGRGAAAVWNHALVPAAQGIAAVVAEIAHVLASAASAVWGTAAEAVRAAWTALAEFFRWLLHSGSRR